MPKISKKSVQAILDLTTAPLEARSIEDFLAGVRKGFDGLYRGLLGPGQNPMTTMNALNAAFSQTTGTIRQRRVLELCAWPIFDKPALPGPVTSLPEFLWLFCLPVVVQFPLSTLTAPLCLPDELFDGKKLLGLVSNSGWVTANACVSGFPTLLSREDIHLYGPRNLAAKFINAELGGNDSLTPLPVAFDEEIESSRAMTFFIIAAARLQVGEKQLLVREGSWPAQEVEDVVREGFAASGIEVESVTSLPACSMAESLFRCSGAGALEFEKVLELAEAHYGIQQVLVRYPVSGMAELIGVDKDNEEILLLPPTPFLEPKTELQRCLATICQKRGLEFKGAFSAVIETSSMLH